MKYTVLQEKRFLQDAITLHSFRLQVPLYPGQDKDYTTFQSTFEEEPYSNKPFKRVLDELKIDLN